MPRLPSLAMLTCLTLLGCEHAEAESVSAHASSLANGGEGQLRNSSDVAVEYAEERELPAARSPNAELSPELGARAGEPSESELLPTHTENMGTAAVSARPPESIWRKPCQFFSR